MNSKIAIALIAVLMTSQAALANRQGGTSNVTNNGKANATSGKVIRGGKAVNARAKAVAVGAQSGDAAAAAAASVFARKTSVAKPLAKPAVRIEAPSIAKTAKSSNASPTVSKEVSDTVKAIESAGLNGKLNGRIGELTSVLSKNAQLLAVAKEIVATHKSKPQLIKLNEARIEGLLIIAKMPADLQNLNGPMPTTPSEISAKAYVALVINAGREAAGWQATTQDNMIEMIITANQTLASSAANSSSAKASDVAAAASTAFDSAASEVSKNKKEKITGEDVLRLCGKA